jgi:hypothetical protein
MRGCNTCLRISCVCHSQRTELTLNEIREALFRIVQRDLVAVGNELIGGICSYVAVEKLHAISKLESAIEALKAYGDRQ